MSAVRQRKAAAPPPGCDGPASASGSRYQRAARPPARPTRSVHIALSLVILACMIVYGQRQSFLKSKNSYTVDNLKGGKPLPEWYAVCSKDGKKVYTVPADVGGGSGAVECVVVGGKEVVDTGSLAHVRRVWGEKGKGNVGAVEGSPDHIRKAGGITIVYLPPGHTVTPGFTDSHTHPLEYGYTRQLPLVGTKSVAEVISVLEDYVKAHPGGGPDDWITGMGWDETKWPVKEFPTAADFDTSPLLRGRPIVLYRVDVHAAWVSPIVLAKIGKLPDKDEEGGKVVRDENGEATGVFIDNAMRWHINPVLPEVTDEIREMALNIMTRDALALGLTGVHDAGQNPKDLDFFKKMANQGKLSALAVTAEKVLPPPYRHLPPDHAYTQMRFYTMLMCVDRATFCGDTVERVTGLQDGRFTLQSVKLVSDGALGSSGAALLEDYSDQPGWKGFLLTEEEKWAPLIKKYYDDGWQVNVHCIGDRANHVVLDGFEAAIGKDKAAGRERRLRIEHAQILTLPDLKRAAEMGIIGSYQPTHATSDMWYAEDRLGPERIKGAYAWRSYINNGGRIALGSDFPVESPHPLKGFYAAVTRRAEDGTSPHGKNGWYPEEKLSRVEALRGFTADPAYAAFSNNTGSLTRGMRFDAVLWDDDLMTVDEDEMLQTKVMATIVDGRIAYGEWKV